MVERLATATATVPVDELFLSLQGEGLELGRPQLFLRLGGCPLRCRYCDTPRSWTAQPQAVVQLRQGSLSVPNPMSAEELHQQLAAVWTSHQAPADLAASTLAVTGGEPLLHASFLRAWLPTWPGKVLLETAGVYPEALAELLPWVDFLSLDWKLAGSLDRGESLLASESCLRVAQAAGVRMQIKFVVDEHTLEETLADALRRTAALVPDVTAILQPATQVGEGPRPPRSEQLLAWTLAYGSLPLDLRVMPQMHPVLGLP